MIYFLVKCLNCFNEGWWASYLEFEIPSNEKSIKENQSADGLLISRKD